MSMKAERYRWQPLAGPRSVALLASTRRRLRTRVSFAVGIAELGGIPARHRHGLDAPVTRRVDRRYRAGARAGRCAAVAWRTFGQDRLEEFAAASAVPVINALTNEFHPCQILADLQTVSEAFGGLAGLRLCFVGDGSSNLAHSYLLGGATAGLHVRIVGTGALLAAA